MTKKEEIIKQYKEGKITIEDLAGMIEDLTIKTKSFNLLIDYKKELQRYVGVRLSSYCNGFFSKEYNLDEYTIKTIMPVGTLEEPEVKIIIEHDNRGIEQLEETIVFRPIDLIEMLEEWTGQESLIKEKLK